MKARVAAGTAVGAGTGAAVGLLASADAASWLGDPSDDPRVFLFIWGSFAFLGALLGAAAASIPDRK